MRRAQIWAQIWTQRILAIVFFACAPSAAHAVNCALASGASQASIAAAVAGLGSGSCTGTASGTTVQFAAGNYSITSQITIPCPSSAAVIQGPTPVGVGTSWPITPTAILTSSVSGGNFAFTGTACSTGTTIQYLQYNGGEPSGGGGGFLFVPPGMNHLTVQWNWFYGVSALQNVLNQIDTLVMLGSGNFSGAHIQNTLIQFNRFGSFGTGECGGQASSGNQGLMNLYGGNNACSGAGFAPPSGSVLCKYQDGQDITHGGGSCGGVGVNNTIDNFTLKNNSFTDLEQPIKHYEAPGTSVWPNTNVLVQANDLAGTHRIGSEAQSSKAPSGPNYLWDSNSFHDAIKPNSGQWGLSLPTNTTDSTNNVLIANTGLSNDKNGQGAFYAGCAVEFWGVNQTSSQNLIQGNWCAGIQWRNFGGLSANNNIVQLPAHPGQCIVDEGYGTPAPSQTGNVCSSTLSAITSAAPTILPTPTGTYSSPIAVTITDNGITSGAGPRGNTSIFYTTDGSTPTTASPWCQSPCSISVNPGATVNAIGMWGAINQPRSYPAGYGFVPSAVRGAHYSAGTTPTLTGVSLSLLGGGASLTTGNSVQACATATYTGVAPVVTCGNGADTYGTTFGTWTTSAGGTATISSSGLVVGVAAGTTNLGVKATQGATNFTSAPFTLTVSNPTVTLTGVTIADGGLTTISSTQTVQATATAQYSNGATQNCTATADPFGTTCGTWLSSTPAAATISSSGLVSGVAAGSTNLTVKATATGGSPSFTSAPLALTVTGSAPPATLTGVTVAGCSAVQAGNTVSCAAKCAYSDSTVTDCTTTDSHGTLANTWLSSNTAAATISSSGVASGVAAGTTSITVHAGSFTSPGFTLTVTATPPATLFLGNSNFDTVGATSANYINATYAVTGTNSGGYTASSCTFYLPTGTSYVAGSKWDCGLVRAPTPTTQASSWLCWNTYTNSGTAADVGWHTVSLPSCGVLPTATAYWVAVDTNHPGQPGEGFTSCGGSACNGPAPTIGNGTFPCAYVSANYGVYTGMGTAMTSGCGPSTTVQSSQYVTLNSPLPTLVGGYLGNPGPTVILSPGGAVQFSAFCQYSDGTFFLCYPTPDQYGNTVTAWTSDAPSVVSIGNIGSAHPGLAMAGTVGTANIQASLTGGHTSTPWGMTVSAVPLPYPPTNPRGMGR